MIAALLLAVVGVGVPMADATAAPLGSIGGGVTVPIGHESELASVQVEVSNNSWWGTTYVGADGTYAVASVPDGDYVVRAIPPFGSELAGARYSGTVGVSGGEILGIDLEMVVGGVLSGTVTVPDGYDPATCRVMAEGLDFNGNTTVAGDGTWLLTGLAADSYRVHAGCGGDDLLPVYYPGVASPREATRVVLAAGETHGGLDLTVSEGGRLAGSVTGPAGPVVGATVAASSDTGYRDTVTDVNGQFELTGLPAGGYRIRVNADGGLAPEYYDDALSWSDATPVPVELGATTSGVDFQLAIGGMLSGTVTVPPGHAVSACEVQAEGQASEGGSGVVEADGGWQIDGLAADEYLVSVRCPGTGLAAQYWPGVYTWADAERVPLATGETRSGVSLALELGGTITGTVTGPSGAVASAWVSASADEGSGYASATTAEDGTFALTGLAPGNYRVSVAGTAGLAAEYYDDVIAWSEATLVAVTLGGTVSEIDVALETGAMLSGVVTVPDGYDPTACSVSASSSETGTSGSVGADGFWRISGLPAGDYLVLAECSGSDLAGEYWPGVYSTDEAQTITVGAAEVRSGLDLAMAVGGSISGVVTGPTGAVGGANVSVSAGLGRSYAATTATDGSFGLVGLSPGDYLVHVQPAAGSDLVPEYYPDAIDSSAAVPVTVTLGSATPGIDVQLSAGGAIVGTVSVPEGHRARDVQVSASGVGTGAWATTMAASDGSYRLAGLTADTYTVEFRDSAGELITQYFDGATSFGGATPVDVTAGSQATGIDAAMVAGGSISGRVSGPDGPVDGVSIWVSSGTGGYGFAMTDIEGEYRVGGLAPGDYVVSADVGDPTVNLVGEYYDDAVSFDQATAVTVGGDTTGIDFVLAPGGTITGRVTVPTGHDVSDVTVSPRGLSAGSSRTAVVDPDGTYRVTGLGAGEYVVRFETWNDPSLIAEYFDGVTSWGDATHVTVRAGGTTSGIDASLEVGGTISGTVSSVDGPAAGVFVAVSGPSSGLATTAVDGSYTVTGLVAGDYTVSFQPGLGSSLVGEYYQDASGWESADSVIVGAGEDVTGVDAVLSLGSTITGTITDQDGLPVVGASVSATPADTSFGYASATTDAQGTYELTGVSDRPVLVRAVSEDGLLAPRYWPGVADPREAQPLTVSGGTTRTGVDLVLPPAGYIAGVVRLPSSVPDYCVVARATTGEDLIAEDCADNGEPYQLDGLAAGEYVVFAYAGDGSIPTMYYPGTQRRSLATGVPVAEGLTTVADLDLADVALLGSELPDIALVLDPAHPRAGDEVTVTVQVSGDAGTSTGVVELWLESGGGFVGDAELVDGEASLPVVLTAADDGFYLFASYGGDLTYTFGSNGVELDLSGSTFTDVPAESPFAAEIGWLAATGITGGYADGGFHPTAAVSRQAMAAFLYRFAGEPAFTTPATSPFTDVSTTSDFYAEICWLADRGITGGYDDGGFHPSAPVSRQAMAAFLYRFAGEPAVTPPDTSPFTDVPRSNSFYGPVTWLAGVGITGGYADGGFHPTAAVSRQAMAAFLFRYSDVFSVG